jgi:hypothetical protein
LGRSGLGYHRNDWYSYGYTDGYTDVDFDSG